MRAFVDQFIDDIRKQGLTERERYELRGVIEEVEELDALPSDPPYAWEVDRDRGLKLNSGGE